MDITKVYRVASIYKHLDTVSIKGVFTDEANKEVKDFVMDKKNFIGFGCSNLRSVSADVVQSLYSLTKILPQDEKGLTTNIKFS